ncbi:putative histidine kinase, classic80 [Deinococcus aerius]|uniref:histidine kinase n=1 Tax=Deinococcus aerius TaxID=200253 RepID=A0A2I9DRT9_9DEIO|nr:HAMP domain-containing sensor histidine kinase [Deinococcus aerius]GBF08151.1 putative histidine kinase, classic80 [Deinococcus aerius]
MRRPFWNSLAWRLTLAFVLLSVLALSTVGVFSYAYTRSEFGRLLTYRARSDTAQQVQTYVQAHGTLAGLRLGGPGGPPRFNGAGPSEPPPAPPPATGGRPDVERGPFAVLDPEYRAVFATPGLPAGTQITGSRRAAADPVRLNGRIVAYLLPSGTLPRPDERSAEFLARTARAVGLAMLAVALVAVLVGVWISRTLLQPLRVLQRGIDALRRGEPHAPLPAARRDEFGELLGAFNDMSAEVTRNQQVRRQLTADIAHDLNTPLSVIGGTLEGMLDGTFRPTPERLARLHRETEHLTRLVSDLRFLALADAGELRLTLEPTDVGALVSHTVGGFRELAERQGVGLTCQVPPGEVRVTLDPTRITQVLQNLIGNALAHTPAGGRIHVAAGVEGERLRVTVRDDGQGIAPGRLPHVFDRLYRGDAARSGTGSGLGLSISRSIIRAHGGQIGIDSAPGQGTTVRFDLPLAPPAVG